MQVVASDSGFKYSPAGMEDLYNVYQTRCFLHLPAPSGIVEATPPAGELFDAAMELAKSLRSKGKDEKTRDTSHIISYWDVG